jgi:hypothetical protein
VDKRDAWTSDTDLYNIKSTLNSVEKLLDAMSGESKYSPPELILGKSSSCEPIDVTHPMFGRFRLDGFDVEKLAGNAARPPILRPIELTRVPEKVETFEEVATALRHIVYACTLLANQQSLVKNTFCLRASLISHFFTRVVPMPLPLGHPDRKKSCFWAGSSRKLRYIFTFIYHTHTNTPIYFQITNSQVRDSSRSSSTSRPRDSTLHRCCVLLTNKSCGRFETSSDDGSDCSCYRCCASHSCM